MGEDPYRAVEQGAPGRIGSRIVYLAETSSTQDVAAELANSGAESGTVVIAETQRAGRGRLGRSWHSPPGLNLYATIILRPRLEVSELCKISLMAGVAVARVLEPMAPGMVGLKWPNDVWLRGRKAGGILAQALGAEQEMMTVLLGIGLNLNLSAAQLPEDLKKTATSLFIASGKTVDRVDVAKALFHELQQLLEEAERDSFDAIIDSWQRYSVLTGRMVEVGEGARSVLGRVMGVDRSGALLIDTGDGEIAPIVAGEVTVRGVDGRRMREE